MCFGWGRLIDGRDERNPCEIVFADHANDVSRRRGEYFCSTLVWRTDYSTQNVCVHPRTAAPQIHNFADGIAIGAAFLGCTTAMGWTVTASVLIHEIPAEIADFIALINGGMSVKQVNEPNPLGVYTAFVRNGCPCFV